MYSLHKNPIGIYEKALPNAFSWEEKFACVKDAGYDYMELSIDESEERLRRLDQRPDEIEKLRTLMQREGIVFPTMCLSAHRRFPFGSRDPAVRKEAMIILEKAILLALRLDIRIIQLAAYDVYYEEPYEGSEAQFIESMRQAVALASRAGVILAMEIMDTPFMGTIERAREIMRHIPSPYFKVYPDIGNLSNFTDDVPAALALGFPDIAAIHIKETKPGIFREVPFGEGQVKFTDIFRRLKELNYTGMFLIEMWADNGRPQSREEASAAIADARMFVLESMQRAGWNI